VQKNGNLKFFFTKMLILTFLQISESLLYVQIKINILFLTVYAISYTDYNKTVMKL